jgi:site-specific DNA-methyltransferase (adenine-specific)
MITLYHGDCLKEMSNIPDGSVDMILADLPYGTTACKWDNVIPFEPLWAHYWRVLKPNGAVVLFGSEPFSSHLRMSQIKYYKYDWVWKKNRPSNPMLARKQCLKIHENVCIFYRFYGAYSPQGITKTNGKPRGGTNPSKTELGFGAKNGTVYKQEYTGYPKSILEFGTNNNKNSHPTQKPVALLEYLIRTYTLEGETVLDNTMGSGSTGVACVNTGRKFIGIEMDDKYFAIAQERINKSQEKLF